MANAVSSARHAGSCLSFEEETFTLYEHKNFQGQNFIALGLTQDARALKSHKSLIITGNGDWTIYDEPYFNGNSLCMKRDNMKVPLFISDLEQPGSPIPYGSIRSAQVGCKSENVIRFNSTVQSLELLF